MRDNLTTETRTICRLCGAYCGIVVETVGSNVVRVRGDAAHPASKGYTCGKGRAIPEFHHDPTRLDHPLLRGKRVGWDDLLDDLALGLSGIVAAQGPHAVAGYSGMGTFGDRTGMITYLQLLGRFGTRQRYSAASVDIFPLWKTYEMVMGYAKEANPMWEPEDSPRVCLVFGQNVVVAHGYASCLLTNPIQRIRAFRAGGGELWVLDPRRTETAELADRHLALQSDSDAVVLAWLVRELLQEGADERELADHTNPDDLARLRVALEPFSTELTARRSGLALDDLRDLVAAVRRSGQVACVSGTGMTFSRNAMVAEWLRLVLMIVTGSMDRPHGMRFPTGVVGPLHERVEWTAAPEDAPPEPGPATHPELARWLDEYPAVALVDEIEAGNVRALLVYGGNPLTAFPDPDRTEAALRSLEVLAVVDIFDKPLTRIATHVLPAADLLEHADLVTRDRASYSPRVVPPLGERRPAWSAFAELGRRLGLDLLDHVDIDSCTDDEVLRSLSTGAEEVFAAGPHGIQADRRDGWFRANALPNGRWRIAPRALVGRLADLLRQEHTAGALRLVSRRQSHTMNSVRYGGASGTRRDLPHLLMHPTDAADRDVDNDSDVVVASSVGEVQATARYDQRLARGVVSLTHGWHDPNVNRLVSPMDDIDPLSGQPPMSGLVVTVLPVLPPPPG
jgi:anaerobic selenocysteine-containing dehydrogenase